MSETIRTITNRDIYMKKQMHALLEQEGIHLDTHLDDSYGIFDEEEQLIATGSCYHNTLRCFAVDAAHRGEGLLNTLVSHLLSIQAERGNTHVFVYTKPGQKRFFCDIGFYPIIDTDWVAFLENRKDGFSNWLHSLGTPQAGKNAAIVMNANPFTKGHLHLVETAAQENDRVHVFVVREEASDFPFSVRMRLVREGTAHLKNIILRDTHAYLISNATFPSYFLPDRATATRAQAMLDVQIFAAVARHLHITSRYIGTEPDNPVTAIYNEVMQEQLPRLGIECHLVERIRSGGRIISASAVRQAFIEDRLEQVEQMLPETTSAFLRSPEAEAIRLTMRKDSEQVHA